MMEVNGWKMLNGSGTLLDIVGICPLFTYSLANGLLYLRDCCGFLNKVLSDGSVNWPCVRRRNNSLKHPEGTTIISDQNACINNFHRFWTVSCSYCQLLLPQIDDCVLWVMGTSEAPLCGYAVGQKVTWAVGQQLCLHCFHFLVILSTADFLTNIKLCLIIFILELWFVSLNWFLCKFKWSYSLLKFPLE